MKAFQTFMKGKKTYTGIIIALIGALGFSDYVSAPEITKIVDIILQLIGFALAIYGRAKTQ